MTSNQEGTDDCREGSDAGVAHGGWVPDDRSGSRPASRSLFSQHYLANRIEEHDEWAEDVSEPLRDLQALYHENKDVLLQLSEAQTEEEFIRPALKILGFVYIPQASLRVGGRVQRPDYALFLSEALKSEAYKVRDDEPAFYSRAAAVCDAKYWGRPLGEARKDDPRDEFNNTNPSFQIVNYLIGSGVDWGILTSGATWRLYYREASSTATEFYEINLVELLEADQPERFKYFFLFFRRDAFTKDAQDRNFLERVREGSATYARVIGDRLKNLVFDEVFPLLSGGFVSYMAARGDDVRSEDAKRRIYEATLSLLYKALFLLYAEARGLLPIDNPGYRTQSLTRTVQQIAERLDRGEPAGRTSTALYDHLLNLFRLIDHGDQALGLPRYNGGLFHFDFSDSSEQDKHPENWFLTRQKVPDHFVARGLDRLARVDGDAIDYGFIGVRHLGAIYEGLLEHRLVVDDVSRGRVHLETDTSRRRASGSYYTPDYVVKYIIENTVGPIVGERAERFGELMSQIDGVRKQLLDRRRGPDSIRRLRARLEGLEQEARETLLDIKICDPAMGSGHFLVEAVDFLTDRFIDILNRYPEHNPVLTMLDGIRQDIVASLRDQGITIDWTRLDDTQLLQRAVMKRCIYGVDLNRMAVELAKVSLWLHSFTVGAPLSFLDHHLRRGDSLIGVWDIEQYFAPDSPRWQDVVRTLSAMVRITHLTDSTVGEVRESYRLFEESQRWINPTKERLNVALATHLVNLGDIGRAEQVADLPADERSGFDKTALDKFGRAQEAAAGKQFFHWKLEFPEVFIDLGRATWRQNPGFDAVVGNPPYFNVDALSEGHLAALGHLYPAIHNKQNDVLYYFLVRGATLLQRRGNFGMIVARYFLEAKVASKLRGYLSRSVRLRSVLDFRNAQVWPKVNVLTLIITFSPVSGGLLPAGAFTAIKTRDVPSSRLAPLVGALLDPGSTQSMSLTADFELFTVDQTQLGESSWLLAPASVQELKAHMSGSSLPLSCLLRSGQGMKSGRNEVFVVDEDTISRYGLERDLLRKYVKTRDIQRYSVSWRGLYLICTYNQTNIDEYPGVKRYLAEHRDELEARFQFRDGTCNWFALSVPQNRELFCHAEKILTPLYATRNKFAADSVHDGRGYIGLTDVYALAPTAQGSACSTRFILAVLNSKTLTYWARQSAKLKRGGYYEYSSATLDPMPIRRIDFSTRRSEREDLVGQARDLHSAGDDAALLDLTSGCLGAKPERADVIHDILAHLADQMTGMREEIDRCQETFVLDLSGYLDNSQLAKVKRLYTPKRPPEQDAKSHLKRLAAYEETVALAEAQLGTLSAETLELDDFWRLNRAQWMWLLRQRLGDVANMSDLVAVHQDYRTRLGPLMRRIQRTDRLIDLIVYRLYGLTEEEIAIVEGGV
jgi:hypothetical protein